MKGRKNIRKLIIQNELSESTQNAMKEEELRKNRIQKRQKLVYNIFLLFYYEFDVLVLLNILV